MSKGKGFKQGSKRGRDDSNTVIETPKENDGASVYVGVPKPNPAAFLSRNIGNSDVFQEEGSERDPQTPRQERQGVSAVPLPNPKGLKKTRQTEEQWAWAERLEELDRQREENRKNKTRSIYH